MGGGLPGVGYPNLGLDAGMQGQMGQYAGMPTVMMANVGGVMQPVVVMPQVGMQGLPGLGLGLGIGLGLGL